MTNTIEQLTQRVARLDAAEQIRRLKLQYAVACDNDYQPDVIAPMFTEDAIWDGGERWGRHDGRQAIYDFFAETSKTISFALHLMIGGDIDVDETATTATGFWQLYEPVAISDGGQGFSAVMAGTYNDEYPLTDDGWKFSVVRLNWAMQARIDQGWHDSRFHI